MFIVKGIRPPANTQDFAYSVFECDYYIVAPSTRNGTNAPGQPPYVPPQKEVELYEKSRTGAPDSQVSCLLVGIENGYYCTVYVMNDRGKTIDTIQARE